jgi:hypothetical protein
MYACAFLVQVGISRSRGSVLPVLWGLHCDVSGVQLGPLQRFCN